MLLTGHWTTSGRPGSDKPRQADTPVPQIHAVKALAMVLPLPTTNHQQNQAAAWKTRELLKELFPGDSPSTLPGRLQGTSRTGKGRRAATVANSQHFFPQKKPPY